MAFPVKPFVKQMRIDGSWSCPQHCVYVCVATRMDGQIYLISRSEALSLYLRCPLAHSITLYLSAIYLYICTSSSLYRCIYIYVYILMFASKLRIGQSQRGRTGTEAKVRGRNNLIVNIDRRRSACRPHNCKPT